MLDRDVYFHSPLTFLACICRKCIQNVSFTHTWQLISKVMSYELDDCGVIPGALDYFSSPPVRKRLWVLSQRCARSTGDFLPECKRQTTWFSGLLGFWILSIVRYSKKQKNTRFGNWICFRPQVRGQETPTQLGPLERASLNHWTMDKVQKPSSPECHIPSSEPFKVFSNSVMFVTYVLFELGLGMRGVRNLRLSMPLWCACHKNTPLSCPWCWICCLN
jgi:hypothetical protein